VLELLFTILVVAHSPCNSLFWFLPCLLRPSVSLFNSPPPCCRRITATPTPFLPPSSNWANVCTLSLLVRAHSNTTSISFMAQMGPQKKNIISLSLSLSEIKDLQTLNFIFLKVKRVGGGKPKIKTRNFKNYSVDTKSFHCLSN
jgi:hypothetical protein